MRDEIIFSKLNNHLKILQQHYPIENIFGIFVTEVGEKEIETEAIIVPLFEDVCTSTREISGSYADGYCNVLDIRTAYEATKCGHPETINALYTNYIIVNPMYQHIYKKILVCNRDVIKAGIECGHPCEILRLGLMKLCRQVWQNSSSNILFLKQLTDSEKLALDGIIKTIGDEGTISQVKVASAVGVSRLTMSNLVMKLKFYEIAEVTYLGNKGTFIKFIDDIVFNIKGDKIR